MKSLHVLLAFCLLTSTSAFAFAAYGVFRDVPEDSWYAASIEHLSALNILQGHPDGTYRPTRPVNRAELAVTLDRLLEYIETGAVAVSPTKTLELDVPFTSQAPTGSWMLPYREACEEASLLMVKAFLAGEKLTSSTANAEILKLVEWEGANSYGIDVGAQDIVDIARGFYDLEAIAYFDEDVSITAIKALLDSGSPVIIPTAGQILAHPNYRGDGPPYHMIVIVGYTQTGFITHDPGVTAGASHIYSYATIEAAIHDWTGSKSTIEEGRKAMVVLKQAT